MDQQIRGDPGADPLGIRRVANRGDVQRLASDVGCRAHCRIEPFQEPAHQHRAAASRGVDDLFDVGERVGDRLLDEQRQAGVDHGHRVGVVKRSRRGDHDGVDAAELGLGQPLRGESLRRRARPAHGSGSAIQASSVESDVDKVQARAPGNQEGIAMRRTTLFALAVDLDAICMGAAGRAAEPLPATQPLVIEGDLAEQMVAGIDRFLLRETADSV